VLIHARVAHVDTTHTDATPRHALLACVKAHVLGAAGTSPDVAFVKSAPAATTLDPARCYALFFSVLERNAERRACKYVVLLLIHHYV
jgi:hypothetical protein